MTRRCRALLGGMLLAMAAPASAGWHTNLRTLPDSGVDVELSSPLDAAPSHGFMPCWVTVKNHSRAPRTWTVRATDGGYMGNGNHRSSASQALRVENDTVARTLVLVPLAPSARDTVYYRPNSLQIEGYGIEDSESSTGVPPHGYPRKPPTAFVGMGAALAVTLWEPLKKEYEDHRGHSLVGSPVDVTLLAPDWRSLSGLDCLWLTEAEYAGLEPAQQTAIRRWIDQGGVFYLCTQDLAPALRAGLGLSDTGVEASPGFGYVKLVSWDGKSLSFENAATAIDAVSSPSRDESVGEATDWDMAKALGNIPLNAPFLIGFILVFAVVVGPVNLFWLAAARRRHRLFWTTPLISLGASLLLLLVIVFQDGFGGRGDRSMLTLLCPDRKETVIVQEQVTRTGVLLSRQFTVSEDLVLAPLRMANAPAKSYEQAGRGYGGDWFASRSLQAQRAEAIVPSRAEIQLLNADAATAGAPPVLVSSVPASLIDIHYKDPAGHHWRGDRLRTGEQITLRPDREAEFSNALGGSGLLTHLQRQVWQREGYFRAAAEDGPFVETLPSIHWQKQRAVYVGPVTSAR